MAGAVSDQELDELACAWHAPDCTADAGGGCILHTDEKEAWTAGYRSGQDSLRADLEAARAERATWKATTVQADELRYEAANQLNLTVHDLALSRATEAELRARVERRDVVVDAARAWREEQLDPVDPSIPVLQAHYTAAEWALSEAIVALDAAEQPARAEQGQG